MSDGFYRAFEERYRGSRDLIKGRLAIYLPFIEPLRLIYPDALAVDLGCGRGEWLEVLRASGIKPIGIDLDQGMLNACHDLGLTVERGDAIAFLSTLPSESQLVVSGFHIAEHLPFEVLQKLVAEALRVLQPGGVLILETPNPENLTVGTSSFYLDPTHVRPIPPLLLAFLPDFCGFKRVKTVRLQEPPHLLATDKTSLLDVFGGVSPDYAVIAQKNAEHGVLSLNASAFDKVYGLDLETLAMRFDSRMAESFQQAETKAQQAETKAQQAETKAQQAETKAQQAETKAQQAETKAQQAVHWVQQQREAELERRAQEAEAQATMQEQRAVAAEQAFQYWQKQANQLHKRILLLHASTSWQITKPLRAFRRLLSGDFSAIGRSTAAVKLKAKQTFRPIVSTGIKYVFKRPVLRNALSPCLKCFPGLHRRLLHVAVNSGAVQGGGDIIPELGFASQNATGLDRSLAEQKYRHLGKAPDIDAILERIKAELEKVSGK
jgi:SAM-dependent methyltransferase